MGGSALESALRDGANAPGLKLIETLLWDGADCPRINLHQARLARSAAALGWAAPADLRELLVGLPAQALRLRVTLDGAGLLALRGLQETERPLEGGSGFLTLPLVFCFLGLLATAAVMWSPWMGMAAFLVAVLAAWFSRSLLEPVRLEVSRG